MINKLFKKDNNASKQSSAETQPQAEPAKVGQTEDKPESTKSRARAKSKSKSVWDLSQFQVPQVEGKTRFHDLGLSLPLMHGIADLGFEYCSPIQAASLPHTMQRRDMVGKAQTGTGKTAAFLVTIIEDLLQNPIEEQRFAGESRALIIAPTRELAIQIAEDAKALCKYTDLKVHTLVGGMDYAKQQTRLHNELNDILVATPGRLLDFCGNEDVHLDMVEIMVIDEADRMLDMGFIPQVRRIINLTPKKAYRQTLLFSATFTPQVMTLMEQWTQDPVMVEIEPENAATDTVEQLIYLTEAQDKYALLYNILKQPNMESAIVFANRRDQCRHLQESLKAHGFKVGILSGEIAQNKRVTTLAAFKSREINVLVATDVAGRGIHIDGISHVINFTLPEEPEDYVHRIGRTGRAGKSGTSISFACEDDSFNLMPIQELLGNPVPCLQPPEELLKEAPKMTKKSSSRPPQGKRPHQGSRR